MNRIVRKKGRPPFHKQISPTKLMGFNASSFKGTLRTREGHREQKVHLTKNTAGIHKQISPKPAHEIQRLKASSLSKEKAHGEHEREHCATSRGVALCFCMTCGQCWRRNLHSRNIHCRSWRNVLLGKHCIGAPYTAGAGEMCSWVSTVCAGMP